MIHNVDNKMELEIAGRKIGAGHTPFVIADIGINHEGDLEKAKKMVADAAKAGAECVKFQMHVVEDEMVPKAREVIPGNADESIYEIMERCSLKREDHEELMRYCKEFGMLYLCTPFSRAAADILNDMGVEAFKIGSGECNNYPLIAHIASFGKPVILSTGMNDIASVSKSVEILKKAGVNFALLHCVSMYPTPHDKVRLGAMTEMKEKFDVPVGLSDHSLGIYTCLGAVPLGASILEKHFTSDKSWEGPDIMISMDPRELKELVEGSKAVHQALGGRKQILSDEQPTIDFAYASIVSIADIRKGDELTEDNIWVKRPGKGGIPAEEFDSVIGKSAARDIPKDQQLSKDDFE